MKTIGFLGCGNMGGALAKAALKSVGAENVLRHETPCYRVDTSLIQCDYFSYLETGKPEFHGEYMMQYSWAEDTCAML